MITEAVTQPGLSHRLFSSELVCVPADSRTPPWRTRNVSARSPQQKNYSHILAIEDSSFKLYAGAKRWHQVLFS